MAGYLDAYGVEDERRSRLIKLAAITIATVLLLAFSAYVFLRNYHEKQVVKQFLSEVNAGHYQQAYRIWGCTDSHPCRDYSYQKFMEDWGPNQARSRWAISAVDGCPTGVVITVGARGLDPQSLWIQRSDKSISFSPWPECQGKRWRFRQFFQRVLGG